MVTSYLSKDGTYPTIHMPRRCLSSLTNKLYISGSTDTISIVRIQCKCFKNVVINMTINLEALKVVDDWLILTLGNKC